MRWGRGLQTWDWDNQQTNGGISPGDVLARGKPKLICLNVEAQNGFSDFSSDAFTGEVVSEVVQQKPDDALFVLATTVLRSIQWGSCIKTYMCPLNYPNVGKQRPKT